MVTLHIKRLKEVAGVRVPHRDWTAMLLAFYGIDASPDILDGVFSRFSAMYEFEMNVRSLLVNANFDIAKNKSDLIDGQMVSSLFTCAIWKRFLSLTTPIFSSASVRVAYWRSVPIIFDLRQRFPSGVVS